MPDVRRPAAPRRGGTRSASPPARIGHGIVELRAARAIPVLHAPTEVAELAFPPSPTDPGEVVRPPSAHAAPRPASVRYLGFRCTTEGREYTLRVDGEGEPRLFVLVIPHSAFTQKLARFQDAPDVCFAMLQRALAADATLTPGAPQVLTPADLAEYRELQARRTPERKRRRTPNVGQ